MVSVLLASLAPLLPMIAGTPVVPPFGYMMLLCWRLDAGLPEGWLHLYDARLIRENVMRRPPPPAIAKRRPALRLALDDDERLERALFAERTFWQSLAECRTHVYERALRPYVSAVRRAIARRKLDLRESHGIRVKCATETLNPDPLRDHGAAKLINDARELTAAQVNPALMEWLPEISEAVILPPQ